MDKNTITGFVLIGLVLIGFSYLSRPSKEQQEQRQRYIDSMTIVKQQAVAEQSQREAAIKEATVQMTVAQTDSARQAEINNNYGVFAAAVNPTITDSAITEVPDNQALITLENNKVELRISPKGGQIVYARVKDYVTYGKEPLILFDEGDAKFELSLITATNHLVNTSDLWFKPLNKTATGVTMRLQAGEVGVIDFIYSLKADDYMTDFTIETSGLNGVLAPSSNSLDIQWFQRMRAQEKGRKLENQYTGLYYKFLSDDVEHFGEASDENKSLSARLRWIGYKNKFFAAALIADEALSATNLSVKTDNSDIGYLKTFMTTTSVPFSLTQKEKIGFKWFFGPAKYKLLRSYDKDVPKERRLELDELIPLGYAWVRPISVYFILPIFDFLSRFFSNYGIIILLLTLAVKIVLYPLTYKGLISSAKMRVLKPQVDELKLKYPKKEQAMELQQATMALYSSAGASPMSGCLPMLLSMPILIALYWLFPTAIELRQQGFLWAEDLSTYDDVFRWNADIPLISFMLGNHLSLFCVLATVVSVFYSKINMNISGGGQQQMPGMNMMIYLMPVMMLFFFNQSASGLSYYFLISSVITIAQTMLFRYTINERKLLAKLEENKKKPKKKSGFMKRLEEAQRAQKEQLRKQQQERDRKMRSGKR
ncbi:MAG: membrane protein insertase YidC [Tannerella sp.]|jgi:YidC/Oxa1 family membrane protein insertase|nr:membrane protein insertase YidC [Tannerella sp.]